jgi:hypothetical protein
MGKTTKMIGATRQPQHQDQLQVHQHQLQQQLQQVHKQQLEAMPALWPAPSAGCKCVALPTQQKGGALVPGTGSSAVARRAPYPGPGFWYPLRQRP